MKLFICADMEGATGIVHRDQLVPEGGAAYAAGCRLLTGDVLAVVEGAIGAGVTEVVVSEGHAHMRNIAIEELPPETVTTTVTRPLDTARTVTGSIGS